MSILVFFVKHILNGGGSGGGMDSRVDSSYIYIYFTFLFLVLEFKNMFYHLFYSVQKFKKIRCL